MVSFLIVSTDQAKRDSYISNYTNKLTIAPVDITYVQRNKEEKRKSLGVEDIKLMQKKLFLKPIQSLTKAIVIEEAQLLTTEAQNALLKILEEPPAHTIILLSSESQETLLPTILSRCQIVELQKEATKFSEKETEDYQIFLETLPQLSIGERLKKAEQLAKEKDQAITWIANIILVLREQLLQNYTQKPQPMTEKLTTLKHFQLLHTLLKTTNVNPRFAIENTLLSLK